MKRRAIAAAVAILGTAVLASSAFAYWSATGSGNASQRLVGAEALLLAPVVARQELRPGASGSVAIRVENPNPFEVQLEAIDLDSTAGSGGFSVDAAHSTCDVGALSFTGADNGGLGWNIPPRVGAGNGTRVIRVLDAIAMNDDADDACQGAIFEVHVQVGG